MAEKDEEFSCARPTGGPVGAPDDDLEENLKLHKDDKGGIPMIQVGQKAPDFGAPAYFKGEFTSVKLSDYLGQWVSLCFYPGDFTFV